MTRKAKPLGPPTMLERAEAAEAARALSRALRDPDERGEAFTYHLDLSRPRRGLWVTNWSRLPGFSKVNGKFVHDLLPGWAYTQAEVRSEMIPDLIALAERGVRPTEATS